MHVQRRDGCLFLSQQQYMLDILARAGMTDCKLCSTPVDTNPKLSMDTGAPVADASDFRSLAGVLQYLTFTRPDITYAVQQICLHMHDPREPHLAALKRILRYIRGTLHLGLLLRPSSSADLVVYSDADWAGCPDTRKSTSGYVVFLGDNLISWSSKRQNTVSRSSAEAEYRAVANAVAEATWLRQLLLELHTRFPARRWSTATTSVRSICPPILFSISGPSTSRLIFTLCASGLLLVMFVFFTFRRLHSMPTPSPKVFLLRSSRSSDPA